MPTRPVTERIPSYLRPYIVQQDESLYTAIDHASWRFILKIAQAFFSKHAHPLYLKGLEQTGISTERIPLISEMDEKLRRFGWRAVAVSGFIPPAVFMEFQSLGILPIACDMRKLEHIAYTPAPDIVHEAAGHAPIIADPSYAAYLRSYGEIARKVIFSSQDQDVYDAIRALSDIKEDPRSTPEQITAAEMRLEEATASNDYVSEATALSRMGWWTFEYGLMGTPENPKIYGAGLLSSVGESYHCLGPEVRKVPFSVDCVNVTYDITRPQPQLFVTPDFETLARELEELASTLAFRRGGVEGLEKAKRARTVTTTQLDSGVQISGVLAEFRLDAKGEVVFLKFSGPVQIAERDAEIEGQGAGYHAQGFSTPVGLIRGLGKTADQLTDADLARLGFKDGSRGTMEFESGIRLEGRLARKGRVLAFEECAVRQGAETLFDPSWGTFDLVGGGKVASVFGGAADREKYLAATGGFRQEPGRPKTNLTDENRELNRLYARVREIRESGERGGKTLAALAEIARELDRAYAEDWLLRYELLELDCAWGLQAEWAPRVRRDLERIAGPAGVHSKAELIGRGLELLKA